MAQWNLNRATWSVTTNSVNAEHRGTLFAKDESQQIRSSITITSVFAGSTGAEFA
jgi:hypothetical protein